MKGISSSREPAFDRRRFTLFFVVAGMFMLVLVGRLYLLQIMKGEEYKRRSESNFVQARRIAHNRGLVFDQSGEVLVDLDRLGGLLAQGGLGHGPGDVDVLTDLRHVGVVVHHVLADHDAGADAENGGAAGGDEGEDEGEEEVRTHGHVVRVQRGQDPVAPGLDGKLANRPGRFSRTIGLSGHLRGSLGWSHAVARHE